MICYLGAAAIQTLALAVAVGEPHGGAGPLVVGGLLLFWVMPVVTTYELVTGAYDPALAKSLLYFVVALVVLGFVMLWREIDLWRRGSGIKQ